MISEPRDGLTHQNEGVESVELQKVIQSLERITLRLKMIGMYSVAFTALGVVCPILIGSGLGRDSSFFFYTFSIGLISTICAILSLVSFDLSASKGSALFKEASDELQWFVRFGDTSEGNGKATQIPLARPQIKTRVVLREYASSTRLPFLSSASNGSAIYAILNLTMAFVDIFLYRFGAHSIQYFK